MTSLQTISLREGFRRLADSIDPAAAALLPTDGIDKTDPMDTPEDRRDDLDDARELWLHLLHGLHQGHIASRILESSHLWELIAPSHWPDVSVCESYDFSELQTEARIQFEYDTSEGHYSLGSSKTVSGPIELDPFSLDHFIYLFTPSSSELGLNPDSAAPLLSDMPAESLGRLLTAWKTDKDIETRSFRQSILDACRYSRIALKPSDKCWLTAYGIFASTGEPFDANSVWPADRYREGTEGHGEILDHYADSLVIGREWLRAYCQADPENRPLPRFWSGETPRPPMLMADESKGSRREARKRETQEKYTDWCRLALQFREEHPDKPGTEIARMVAKSSKYGGQPDTISQQLYRTCLGWRKQKSI